MDPTDATPSEPPAPSAAAPEEPALAPESKVKARPKPKAPAGPQAPALASMLVRVAALVGFGVSALLMTEYLLPLGAGTCGPGGGCETVRQCSLSGIGWFKWPIVGMLGYGTVLALSLRNSAQSARWVRPLALSGGAVAALLIVLQQAVCHAWCKYCIATDVSGLVMAAAALVATKPTGMLAPASGRVQRLLGVGAVAALGLASLPYVQFQRYRAQVQATVDVPQQVDTLSDAILREQRPGLATIVEFADFECPYCRRQHLVLREVLERYGTRVRFVRKHVPLSFHQHAEGAARAACCAEAQGRGEPMSDMLFRGEDISASGCERLAGQLGIDMARYRTCLNSSETNNRLTSDRNDATAAHVAGLPTMFVGRERFEGVVSAEALRASIDRALSGAPAPAATPAGAPTPAPAPGA